MPPRRLALSAIMSMLPLALIACGEKKQTDPRTEPPLVRVATVQDAAFDTRSFTGTVAARVESSLGFRVQGKVLQRLVDTGQAVKRGQVLMRIDPSDLRLAASAQLDAVSAAKAHAQQTAQDEARYRDLRSTGAISASSYDQIAAAAEAAKAQLSAAEAQAQVARNVSGYSELVADSDGVVMETLAEPGQVVSAGQPVVRLARSGDREAVIQLPETVRPKLGSSAVAILFGKKDPGTPAKLRQLSETADKTTRTFEARYVLGGELAQSPLGATVTIKIPELNAGGSKRWSVPINALFDAGKGAGVWTIQGEPTQVSWKPVTVLKLNDDSADVTAQFKQGDRIVALGAHMLREGIAVRITEQAATKVGVKP